MDSDGLNSSSSFARLEYNSLDSQDAVINDTSWKLSESLDLSSVDILKPNWSPNDSTHKTDSVKQNTSAKIEGSKSEESTSNTLSSFSRSQASSSVGDFQCTQL